MHPTDGALHSRGDRYSSFLAVSYPRSQLLHESDGPFERHGGSAYHRTFYVHNDCLIYFLSSSSQENTRKYRLNRIEQLHIQFLEKKRKLQLVEKRNKQNKKRRIIRTPSYLSSIKNQPLAESCNSGTKPHPE